MVVLTKKRGKNASVFINPIPSASNKNDGPDSVERVHKSPESPKTIEKLESFADHDLGNIQNVTPSMHLINTHLLYRKDNSGGYSSDICTDDRFFHEVLFLRKELGNKQKTINNLLNIINDMHRNSNRPCNNSNKLGNNSYKNTNAQPVQISVTAEEGFHQTQNRNT